MQDLMQYLQNRAWCFGRFAKFHPSATRAVPLKATQSGPAADRPSRETGSAQRGKDPPMTQQNDNFETPPAVEPTHYDGPTKREQRAWIQGTTSSSRR